MFKEPHLVPIDARFMRLGRYAHQSYTQKLEDEKKKKEQDHQRKFQAEQERIAVAEKQEADEKERLQAIKSGSRMKRKCGVLESEASNLKEKLQAATRLFETGNDKLKTAMEKKDFMEINVVLAILESAQQKMTTTQQEIDKNQCKRRKLDKKKETLLDSFLNSTSTSSSHK